MLVDCSYSNHVDMVTRNIIKIIKSYPMSPKHIPMIYWLVVSNMTFIFDKIWDNPSH